MIFGYKQLKINSLEIYSRFSPQYAKLIESLCSSKLFPSGIIVRGDIGVGKSTFAEVLTKHYYRNSTLANTGIILVDTPIDNSAQYCREILTQANRLIQIYNSRIFIIFDEAHILSFAAQQVFLASLERENNLTVLFVTSDTSKLCEAIQNRCLLVNIEQFKTNEQIQAFAAYVFNNLEPEVRVSIENNYIRFNNSSIYQTSGRDIINAILYGDFSAYENIGEIKSIKNIEEYLLKKIKNTDKINLNNILSIIADYLLDQECTCTKSVTCQNCNKINTFIRLSTFINNTKSLLLMLKLLK